MTYRWEKKDNERWSSFQPFLTLLPSLKDFTHPVLMSRDITYQLFGSDVLREIKALNSTFKADYKTCWELIQENKVLFREFHKKGIFSWDSFIVFEFILIHL